MESLLALSKMSRSLAYKLAAADIKTAEALADCSVSELVELIGIEKKLAGELIMEAREPWFESEEKKEGEEGENGRESGSRQGSGTKKPAGERERMKREVGGGKEESEEQRERQTRTRKNKKCQ